MNKKLIFIKSTSPYLDSTENFALKVLHDPKYDNHPLINKQAIIDAFDEYKDKMNPFNMQIKPSNHALNVEGEYIAKNIPEIPSVVIQDICTKDVLYKVLDKNEDTTHIALTAYVAGMDNTIEIIKTIQADFSHLKLMVGGVGTLYSLLRELVPLKNLCVGEGVNFIRKKFNLPLILPQEFIIPRIKGPIGGFALPINVHYLVTQNGCPNRCDFCMAPVFYQKHFLRSSKEKIINYFIEVSARSKGDSIVFITDPNAFFPRVTWKHVFEYFIEHPHTLENDIYLMCLTSLRHVNDFNIEKIQTSPLKILIANYGIESTLDGGYAKNKGDSHKMIERLNKNNIITYQTFIIGFPNHDVPTMRQDIANNIQYEADFYRITAFKPVPGTVLYNQLKAEGRIYGNELPPEFLYALGYLPFKHKHLGTGFDILKHCFYGYYETEKKLLNPCLRLTNKFLNILDNKYSKIINTLASLLTNASKSGLESFKARMPENLTSEYKKMMDKNIIQVSTYKKRK